MCKWPLLVPFLFLDSLSIPYLAADSYRCVRKVIKTGDSAREVLKKCGHPDHKDCGHKEIKGHRHPWFHFKIKIDGNTTRNRVECWYYQKNSRSIERAVLIYRGQVKAIEMKRR